MRQVFTILFLLTLISCNQHRNDTILTNNEAEKLASNNLRKQIISSEGIFLLDTIKSVYLIPIGQRFLNKEENIENNGTLGLIGSKRHTDKYQGYNNYVVYFEKSKKSVNIFNERYLVLMQEYRKVDNDNIILFEGINTDSDKNGKFDYDDIKTLFVYSVNEGKLNKIFEPFNHLISYTIVPDTKNIIVQFGIDRDSSGTYDMKYEPSHYLQYDFETNQKYDVIGDSLMNAMQKILDGK